MSSKAAGGFDDLEDEAVADQPAEAEGAAPAGEAATTRGARVAVAEVASRLESGRLSPDLYDSLLDEAGERMKGYDRSGEKQQGVTFRRGSGFIRRDHARQRQWKRQNQQDLGIPFTLCILCC